MKKLFSRLCLLFLFIAYTAAFGMLPLMLTQKPTLEIIGLAFAAGIGTFCGIIGDKRNPTPGLFGGLISTIAIVFITFGVESVPVFYASVIFMFVWPSLMTIRLLRCAYKIVPKDAVGIDQAGRVYYPNERYRENELAGDLSVTVHDKPFEVSLETDVVCADASIQRINVRLKAALNPLSPRIDLPFACKMLHIKAEKAVRELATGKTLGSFLRDVKNFSPVISTGDCQFDISNLELSLSLNQVT